MDYSIIIDWRSPHLSFKGCLVYIFIFILFLIEIPVCKECKPWSDATFCGFWSGSTLLAYVPNRGCYGDMGWRIIIYMSLRMTNPTKWPMCPAKTQISLGVCPVWSVSSLCALWVDKDSRFLHADSKDSDRTGRMPRLSWVFAGRTGHFVGFVMHWLIFQLK